MEQVMKVCHWGIAELTKLHWTAGSHEQTRNIGLAVIYSTVESQPET